MRVVLTVQRSVVVGRPSPASCELLLEILVLVGVRAVGGRLNRVLGERVEPVLGDGERLLRVLVVRVVNPEPKLCELLEPFLGSAAEPVPPIKKARARPFSSPRIVSSPPGWTSASNLLSHPQQAKRNRFSGSVCSSCSSLARALESIGRWHAGHTPSPSLSTQHTPSRPYFRS